ncbi:Inositol monophosphatase ttx-7 [Trichinella pseudospiralis]|uniref:Inositol-1-monophosphatase n=1 Tax=Trichinella pseudospiralis TaxID=6337 RepID=A0A0V1IML9_TRIPS|nr:Inositol monophosphatase ttx-7 [Trichinella pseudospiralis]KRX92437.1 Inositol monophosphatase ttx-7 [Trichinella pseudospiralis]KRY75646.1 Inositol monophosphatase ttx-7 [Trichinella pseudospiralis]KRZ24082.1 Inositol monophosphatase ttx-7 [Trichinella pseudospiralis]KRZ43481.1 Inositol monophosphatase ttx-7 [Trichinella pseudospiralis]
MEREAYRVVLRLVQESGNLIRDAFRRAGAVNVMTKTSDVDLVTDVDQKVEQVLVDGIRSKFPDHQFIGEESTAMGKKGTFTDAPTWIIDPIDGTTNFVHKYTLHFEANLLFKAELFVFQRVPYVCISIALYMKKEPRIGIVYNPILEELFTARKGLGAFRNGFPIQSSNTTGMFFLLNKALLLLTFGVQNRFSLPNAVDVYLQNNKRIVEQGIRGHRSFGSAALNMCYVALGCADAYIEFGLHCWDIAAGRLIVEEAGGLVIDPSGGPIDIMARRVLACSTAELGKAIGDIVEVIDLPKD